MTQDSDQVPTAYAFSRYLGKLGLVEEISNKIKLKTNWILDLKKYLKPKTTSWKLKNGLTYSILLEQMRILWKEPSSYDL